jgi:hypothetical protein
VETVAEDGGKKSKDSGDVAGPTIHQEKPQKPSQLSGITSNPRAGREGAKVRRDGYRAGRQRREDLSRELRLEGLNSEAPRETARVETPDLQPSPANAASDTARSLNASAADPSLRIGRHAERVERLLRSFRNARLTDNDPTLDAADARRQSKRLLYSNIALRREAAGAGDLPVEGLLDSVEPILIDISNLPNNPSPDAVGSIKERIRRRQLVGVLQAQAMLDSKP